MQIKIDKQNRHYVLTKLKSSPEYKSIFIRKHQKRWLENKMSEPISNCQRCGEAVLKTDLDHKCMGYIVEYCYYCGSYHRGVCCLYLVVCDKMCCTLTKSFTKCQFSGPWKEVTHHMRTCNFKCSTCVKVKNPIK